MTPRSLALLVSAALLVPSAPAQEIVVASGDLVPGVGRVTRIQGLAVDDAGRTLVLVDTIHPDPEADRALLLDGVLVAREGQALAAPRGATLEAFGDLALVTGGGALARLILDDTAAGVADDSGLFALPGPALLLQESAISGAPQFGPGTTYGLFWGAKAGAPGNLLAMATVDDPAIVTASERALVLLDVDGTGAVRGESVVVRTGDVLVGQTEAVETLATQGSSWDVDAAGRVLFAARLEGDPAVDGVVYMDDTLLAQEGSPSPVPGRSWAGLATAEVALDGAGGWVLRGGLDGDPGSDEVIVRNGVKLVQLRDVLPDISPFVLISLGAGPVLVGGNGNVLWFGRWNDPNQPEDSGLFLNRHLLVQEGVTVVDGSIVDFLGTYPAHYALSPDGQQVLYQANLEDGRDVAVLLDVGPWTYLDGSLEGSPGFPAAAGAGPLEPGTPVSVSLTGASPGATAWFVLGLSAANAPFKGGTLVPALDLYTALPTDGNGELLAATTWPAGVPSGFTTYFQWWIVDPGGILGFAASNAVAGTSP